MATKYSTLSLDEELPREKSRKGFYVLVGFAVVALAGVATLTVTGHGKMDTAVDASGPFDMTLGSVENCDRGSDPAKFMAQLPRYDPRFTELKKRDAAFANACYYAFRCCTTGDGSCGQGSDLDLGGDCGTCLKQHPPRKVARECELYFDKKISTGKGGSIACADKFGRLTPASVKKDPRCKRFQSQPPYTVADLRAGRKPKFNPAKDNTMLEGIFNKLDNCMPEGGGKGNGFINRFTKQCFQLFSWCDQMCPRDGDNSIEHKYCKNCFGASQQAIRQSNIAVASKHKAQGIAALKEAAARAANKKMMENRARNERKE